MDHKTLPNQCHLTKTLQSIPYQLEVVVGIFVFIVFLSCTNRAPSRIKKERNEYQKKSEKSIKVINQAINKLEARLDSVGDEAKPELEHQLQNLKKLKNNLENQSKEIGETTEKDWSKLKSELDETIHKSQTEINNITKKFNNENK